jgi:hypothetical protein
MSDIGDEMKRQKLRRERAELQQLGSTVYSGVLQLLSELRVPNEHATVILSATLASVALMTGVSLKDLQEQVAGAYAAMEAHTAAREHGGVPLRGGDDGGGGN